MDVVRDPKVGTFRSVGLPGLDFEAFHRHELTRRLREGGQERVAWDVAEAPPLCLQTPDGRAFSYVPRRKGGGSTGSRGARDARRRHASLEIVPGRVDDAELVIEIEAEAWQDYVHELRTRIGLLYSGAVRFLRGSYDDWDAWEPALRSLYSGTPIYDPSNLDLVDVDGSPLDLHRRFDPDDDPGRLAHFLKKTGYLVLRGVFDAERLEVISAETDRLRAEATEGGRDSWWTEDARTGERYPFHLHYMGLRSEPIAALEKDPELSRLAALSGAKVAAVSERDTGTHAILKEYPSEGDMSSFANLPWHKDCGLGGCPVTCPRVHIGIQLDAANADSSQLFMLAGSAGRVCHEPANKQEWDRLPVVGLETEPGDATLHMGCGLHAGPRPSGSKRRRTIYVRFDNPRVFEVTEPFETYDQVIPGYGSGALPSVDELKAAAYT